MKIPFPLLLLSLSALALPSLADRQGNPNRPDFAFVHELLETDTPEMKVAKAAKTLPRPNQVLWQRLETTFFIHFGPNTFNHVEWGTGHESPSDFRPTDLDARQWVAEIKNAGGRMLMLVVKHHEGFCLWPTRYTEHSVAASPWRDGQGDLVREVAEACREAGLKLGIYLSPADLFQIESPDGLYGNGSEVRRSLIPTDPGSFLSDPTRGREVPMGSPVFEYEVDDYNRYFLNQLYELLTEYGPVHELWFDGAHPKQTDPPQTYNRAAWYELINTLAPEAVIAIKGPDVRWVGNERGISRETEWSPLPVPIHPDKFDWGDMRAEDLGSRARLEAGRFLTWYPAEADVPILHGWFWAPNNRVRPVEELVNIYFSSVGRNSNLLLNLSPDERGLVPENQVRPLRAMAAVVRDTFARDLAAGAEIAASHSQAGHPPENARDGDLDSWWEPPPGVDHPYLLLEWEEPVEFDVVSVQEAIAQRGQRIERFVVESWQGHGWVEHKSSTTVGHRRLLRLAEPVVARQVRVRIIESRLEPSVAMVSLHRLAAPISEPDIRQLADGSVVISGSGQDTIHFTLDGSDPGAESPVYKEPIRMPKGGLIRAIAVREDASSLVVERRLGFPPALLSASAKASHPDHPPQNAIDGNPETFWHTPWGDGDKSGHPHAFQIDLPEAGMVAGLTYLPRQDGSPNGLIRRYRIETSMDGEQWNLAVEGDFGNILNNPLEQLVEFAPRQARHVRLISLSEAGERPFASAAGIGVLPPTH